METQTSNLPKSGLAITSLVLGILSFIPLVGVLLGLLAIIFGTIAGSKIKKGLYSGMRLSNIGTILGILGILLSVTLYGSLYYFGFVAKGGPFEQPKKEVSVQILTQVAGTLELYKAKNGTYPTSLDELKRDGYQVFTSDHYMKPFHYEVGEDLMSYELRSLGIDGEYGTSDDLFPIK